MELLCFRCAWFILSIWTVQLVVFVQGEAPTAILEAPNGGVERKFVHIVCRVTGIPNPIITWYKNGTVLAKSFRISKMTIPDGEVIKIRLRQVDHEAYYECVASNVNGMARSRKAWLKVYKPRSPPPGYPKISKEPTFQRVVSGGSATFDCGATGNPAPVISWLRDSKPVDLSDPRISIPRPGALKFSNANSSDTSLFVCVATNSLGMTYSRQARLLHIVVNTKPVITKPPMPITVNPETDVHLNCTATGTPQPDIRWEHKGRTVGYSVLTIENIQKSGNYTCIAENSVGSSRASTSVTVRKVPFTPTKPTGTQRTAHSITVTWQPTGNHSIDSYILYYREKSASKWILVKDIRGRTFTTLDNLEPYTTYQFRVFAVNNIGLSKPSPLAEMTTLEKAPGTPPTNVQAWGISDTSFKATWLPPSQPNGRLTGYRLYLTTNLKGKWLYRVSGENEMIVRGLQKKTTYYYTLYAYNSVGEGPYSGTYAVKTSKGAPGQPKNVRVKVLSPRSIQVTWKAPTYTGNGIYVYEVYCNKSRDTANTYTVANDVFAYEIRELHPHTNYRIQVAARSSDVGPLSFAKVVKTLEDVPSAPPANISSTSVEPTSLEISWDPPPLSHRNGRITNYTIKYREKGEQATFLTVDGNKLSVRLHNLKKYTTYFVWVTASTSVGPGPRSSKHNFTTEEDIPREAPRHLKCDVLNSTAIRVRWSAPLQSQGGRIRGYVVFYTKVDDLGKELIPPEQTQVKFTASEHQLSLMLTKLDPDSTYEIEVSAYSNKGDGERSISVLAKTLPKPPDAPYVTGEAHSSSLGTNVTIKWFTAAPNILSYRLRYGKSLHNLRGRDHSKVKLKEMPFPPQTKKHLFKELDLGVWYLFKVSIQSTAGWSPETPIWVQMPPGPPTGPPLQVRSQAVSSTEIRVTWLEPDKWQRNGPLIGYTVVYNPLKRKRRVGVKNITNPNQTQALLTGLRMFIEYEIRVRALGLKGPGPLSRPVVEKTNEGVPSPPRGLLEVARSTDAITISWQPPQSPNGEVLSYLVIYSDAVKLPLSQWSSRGVKGLRATLKALSRDTKYWIRVAAETLVGTGNYSSPIFVKTLKYDLPESCRDLQFESKGSDLVVLNWKPPVTDAGITKYKITYSGTKSYTEKGERKQLSHIRDVKLDAVSPGLQSHTLKGLVPHTTYKIELSAVNSMGEGPSTTLTLKTDTGKPPALTRPVIIEEKSSNEYLPMKLEAASERNGPISHYVVIVVPLGKSNQLPKDKSPDDFFGELRRKREAESNNEEPYIAAKFSPSELPTTFNVGDESFKNLYGYYNKKLTKGSYYTMFTRAYVKSNKGDVLYTSSPFVTPVKFGDSSKGGSTGAVQDPEEHAGGGLNMMFIIIPVAALILLTAIIVIAVVVCRRRKRKSKKSKSLDDDKAEPSDPVEMKRMTIQTPAMMDHPPIPVSELLNHNNSLKAERNSKFLHEYESIEPGETFTSEASSQECNKSKNRYPNIVAYDHSRVHLSIVDGIVGSDYINANFCDGYRKENAYIATQGPLEETIEDFWRMIWEHKTFTIVMLTELEERGKIKCEQYWPTDGAELYGDIEVTVTDWIEFANYTITTLQICKEGAPQPREVKHFQFAGWPDHSVPPHPTPFLAFLRRVRFYNPTDAGPIVVHCSGGVGRTACFIVIDSMLERVKHENTVDIYGHVTVLRTQRNFMVQNEEQYIFIHDALLEAVSCGNTEVHARNLVQHIKRLTEPSEGGTAGLAEEFRKLSNPNQARRLKQGTGSLTHNRSKNRLANILPYESTRVQLISTRGIEGSDYINASYIDGYRQRGAYIATQGPLQETVDDFWRMLMEHNSNIVVMLTQLYEGDRERCYQYWPTDRSAKHQYYIVDPVSEQEFPQFVIREFKVKDIMNDNVRNIKQFHFHGWTESVPKSGEGILELIGQIQRTYEQQEEEGPITVHCSDGVGRTGVFCALSIVLERMRSEGVVDLFQTVKLLRTQRPNMIQNKEQYLFCYQRALEYLSSFDHYAV